MIICINKETHNEKQTKYHVGFSFGGGLVIKAVTVLQEVVVFKEMVPAY